MCLWLISEALDRVQSTVYQITAAGVLKREILRFFKWLQWLLRGYLGFLRFCPAVCAAILDWFSKCIERFKRF